ncbi:MAG: IS110 family transposase [Candidatus Rokuibacteriota bacterium]
MQGKAASTPSADMVGYVGIDACKAHLDVYLHPIGQQLRVANTREGLKMLRRQIEPHCVALIVMEATGKFHRLAHRMLHAWGYAVAVVNPYRSRKLADALGALAKTDRIDARLLAIFGESLKPKATPPAPKLLAELQELVLARTAATAEAVALANRLGAAESAFLKSELRRQVKTLESHIARLQAEIDRLIANDPTFARRFEILSSIPGVGPATAATLIACLAELGQLKAKQIAMLVGVAPVNHDSGERRGQQHIKGGRAFVRRALYMAAVVATRFHPDLKRFYRQLRDNAKKPKVALTAVMRKLVILANTLVAENRLWEPRHA